MNYEKTLKSLVQNYGFKEARSEKLPTVNFVYPDYIADGNTEDFRFSNTLRAELSERRNIVLEDFKDKKIVWTNNEQILSEVDSISPRLGINDIISGRINSIYSGYTQLLFVGANEYGMSSYIVKPIVDGTMAWFELTINERSSVEHLLIQKAEDKPYRTFVQRIFGGKSK